MKLTASDVLAKSFIGKKVGEILKYSQSWTNEQIVQFKSTGERPTFEKKDIEVKEWSVLQWFLECGPVNNLLGSSNNQKRRWLEEGAVEINGQKLGPNDIFPYGELYSLVFFRGSKFQVTMV